MPDVMLQVGDWGKDLDDREFQIAAIGEKQITTTAGRLVWRPNVTPIDPPEEVTPAHDELARICSNCGNPDCAKCDECDCVPCIDGHSKDCSSYMEPCVHCGADTDTFYDGEYWRCYNAYWCIKREQGKQHS